MCTGVIDGSNEHEAGSLEDVNSERGENAHRVHYVFLSISLTVVVLKPNLVLAVCSLAFTLDTGKEDGG